MSGYCKKHQNLYAGGYCVACANETASSERPLDRVVSCEDGKKRNPECLGTYDPYTGDYDCEYSTTLICEECKYGVGRKDPEAKCNQSN